MNSPAVTRFQVCIYAPNHGSYAGAYIAATPLRPGQLNMLAASEHAGRFGTFSESRAILRSVMHVLIVFWLELLAPTHVLNFGSV